MSDEVYRRQVARLFERSGFYREKLSRAGFVSPADAGGLADIAKLPFTEKDELRQSQAAQPPLGSHAAVGMGEVARIYSTSGTSGTPLYIPLSKADTEDWREIGRKTYSRNGLKAGESVVTTFGAGPFVAGASLAAIEAIGVNHIPTGVGNTEKVLAALRRLRPQALTCTPSYGLYLAEKLAGEKTSIERIIVGGEPGGGEESFRRKLEDAWQAKVYEIMGIGDIAASLWGECPAQAGMHFSADGIIHVELIEPETGKSVALRDGATGELVYTHLKREAAPLLRFRSRDHVQVWTGECSCKRRTLRVKCIGRTDDMLIVRGVNVFPTQIEEILLAEARLSAHYVLELRRDGRLDDLTVVSELKTELPERATDRETIAHAVSLRIKDLVGVTARVQLVDPGTIERSLGKAKRVVDLRH